MNLIRHPDDVKAESFCGCIACGKPKLIYSRTHYAQYNAPACSEECRAEIIVVLNEATRILKWLESPAAAFRFQRERVELDVVVRGTNSVSRFSGPVKSNESPLTGWPTLKRRIRKTCRRLTLAALKNKFDELKTNDRLTPASKMAFLRNIKVIKAEPSSAVIPDRSVAASVSIFSKFGRGDLRLAILADTHCPGFDRSSLDPEKVHRPETIYVNLRTEEILLALGVDAACLGKPADEVMRAARRALKASHPDHGGDSTELFQKNHRLLKQLPDALARPRIRSSGGHRTDIIQGLPGAFCYGFDDSSYVPDDGAWFNPLPLKGCQCVACRQ